MSVNDSALYTYGIIDLHSYRAVLQNREINLEPRISTFSHLANAILSKHKRLAKSRFWYMQCIKGTTSFNYKTVINKLVLEIIS